MSLLLELSFLTEIIFFNNLTTKKVFEGAVFNKEHLHIILYLIPLISYVISSQIHQYWKTETRSKDGNDGLPRLHLSRSWENQNNVQREMVECYSWHLQKLWKKETATTRKQNGILFEVKNFKKLQEWPDKPQILKASTSFVAFLYFTQNYNWNQSRLR